jgi:predicted Holliday junction resolvase-like endonuclease
VADLLIAALFGVVAGIVLTAVLLHRSAAARARDRFEAWRADERAGLRHRTLAAARGGIKAEVAEGFADVVDAFPFEASDARFVGDPVAFVVFDGHTEVKDRASPSLRGVSFVTMAAPDGDGDDPGLLVAECVAGARVEWLTLRLP